MQRLPQLHRHVPFFAPPANVVYLHLARRLGARPIPHRCYDGHVRAYQRCLSDQLHGPYSAPLGHRALLPHLHLQLPHLLLDVPANEPLRARRGPPQCPSHAVHGRAVLLPGHGISRIRYVCPSFQLELIFSSLHASRLHPDHRRRERPARRPDGHCQRALANGWLRHAYDRTDARYIAFCAFAPAQPTGRKPGVLRLYRNNAPCHLRGVLPAQRQAAPGIERCAGLNGGYLMVSLAVVILNLGLSFPSPPENAG